MMSLIFLLLWLISSMVATTWPTTCPPRMATSALATAIWLAWRAASALWRMVLLSSSMLAAVSCRLLAACSVRAARSLLPLAISRLAVSMPALDCWTCATSPRSDDCMPASAPMRLAGSHTGGMAPVRSPSAMRRRAVRATAGSPPISRRRVRCTTRPSTTATPIASAASAIASQRARSALCLTLWWVCADSWPDASRSCNSSARSVRQAGVSSRLSTSMAWAASVLTSASTLSCACACAPRSATREASAGSTGVPRADCSVAWCASSNAERAACRLS
ncbi:hypothetical protein FQZ97_906810 [compost metagenome]